jgi:hypothetical protein
MKSNPQYLLPEHQRNTPSCSWCKFTELVMVMPPSDLTMILCDACILQFTELPEEKQVIVQTEWVYYLRRN